MSAMPVYEYRCRRCSHEWESEQRITEAALKTCVECGGNFAERQIPSRTCFTLSGGGWARDLYGSAKR